MTTRERDEAGASSVEYGLLVFAIAALIVVIVFALGEVTTELFDDSCSTIAAKASSSPGC